LELGNFRNKPKVEIQEESNANPEFKKFEPPKVEARTSEPPKTEFVKPEYKELDFSKPERKPKEEVKLWSRKGREELAAEHKEEAKVDNDMTRAEKKEDREERWEERREERRDKPRPEYREKGKPAVDV
jgi:hypothetical protein